MSPGGRLSTLPPAGPPDSVEALLERARALSGLTLGQLADALAVPFPDDLGRHKGFIGNLVERALGSTASTRPRPDFEALGVELKTLPTDREGRPRESTFVCTASLTRMSRETWASSKVREKLARVLFVLVESEPGMVARERRLGRSLWFEPDEQEEALLRADWEDLAHLIASGLVDAVSAKRGVALQVRPKARHAGVRRKAKDGDGDAFSTLPRGFYLRRSFTTAALAKRIALSATLAPRSPSFPSG